MHAGVPLEAVDAGTERRHQCGIPAEPGSGIADVQVRAPMQPDGARQQLAATGRHAPDQIPRGIGRRLLIHDAAPLVHGFLVGDSAEPARPTCRRGRMRESTLRLRR